MVIRNTDLHHNVDYTPFEGMTVQGWPVTVLSRGQVICDGGTLHGRKGMGRFLECGPPEPVTALRARAGATLDLGERSWISG